MRFTLTKPSQSAQDWRYPRLTMSTFISGVRTSLEALVQPQRLPDWEAFQRDIQIHLYDAKSIVVAQGEHDAHVYIVLEGIVKLSYEDMNGAINTKSFVTEGSIIANLSALEGQPATYSTVAYTKARIATIPYRSLQILMDKHHVWERVCRKLVTALAIKKERREFEFLTMTPLERWQNLQLESPDLVRRISQSELAGLIGITPVALSRIKGRQRALRQNPIGAMSTLTP
jgi:CRP-like cAMP-binding protein